jgi:hypothetical protein
MRVLALAAFALVVAADHSAEAASCGKGMLWPYVRQPGDCLTDAEIQAGLRGVYNGTVDTNPDVGAMAPVAPVQGGEITGNAGPAPAPAAPVVATTPAPAAPAVAVPAAPVVPASALAGCTKGTLWPFVKSAGDCPSAVEQRRTTGNPICTYREPGDCQRNMVVPVQAYNQTAVTTTPVRATSAVSGQAAPAPAARPSVPDPSATPTCTKGALWPFVRKPGDCPTTAEQRRGR